MSTKRLYGIKALLIAGMISAVLYWHHNNKSEKKKCVTPVHIFTEHDLRQFKTRDSLYKNAVPGTYVINGDSFYNRPSVYQEGPGGIKVEYPDSNRYFYFAYQWGSDDRGSMTCYDSKVPPLDKITEAFVKHNKRLKPCPGNEIIITFIYEFKNKADYENFTK